MSNETPDGGTASVTIVEDLFLTESFLIKGRIARKYHRLTKMLEDHDRLFLQIADATMVSLRGGEVIRAPQVHVNVHELILAHELVEIAGDPAMRHLAADGKSTRIRAFYNGSVQLEISGRVEPGAYEAAHQGGRRYFVVGEPVIRGLNLDGNKELGALKSMGYGIVQKSKLAYVYDFGG
jgi:hypothetical protein